MQNDHHKHPTPRQNHERVRRLHHQVANCGKPVRPADLILPQTDYNQKAASQADGIVRGCYALQTWEHAISGAAMELRDIIEALEAGTSSDPLALMEEVESAARDLLHLLGASE